LGQTHTDLVFGSDSLPVSLLKKDGVDAAWGTTCGCSDATCTELIDTIASKSKKTVRNTKRCHGQLANRDAVRSLALQPPSWLESRTLNTTNGTTRSEYRLACVSQRDSGLTAIVVPTGQHCLHLGSVDDPLLSCCVVTSVIVVW
jgi:hypothetical protein